MFSSPPVKSPLHATDWDLASWLSWAERLHVREIDLDLDRSRAVLKRMALPEHPPYKIITVAGTNGKGSSVAMLDAIYRAAGVRTACYTSPHLLRYNERIRINGIEASDERICEAFARVAAACGSTPLTYFEFGTLAAFSIFAEESIDLAILEVGMGGRLDTVNLLDPDVALITTIAIDHVQWLGNTRESIAREKAGIFRAGKRAICADPAPPDNLPEIAKDCGAPMWRAGIDFFHRPHRQGFSYQGVMLEYSPLPKPNLFGDYQFQNAAGVLAAVEALSPCFPVSRQAVAEGLSQVFVPGRFQRFPGSVEVVLDVAHNPQGGEALAHCLRSAPAEGSTHFVLGMMKDKDIEQFLRLVAPYGQSWHAGGLPVVRGATADHLCEAIARSGAQGAIVAYDNIDAAYLGAKNVAKAGDRIIVCGSFLTVAAILALLQSEQAG